jgi:TRAP-type uncharacterized transport system, periplasmic component
MRLSRIAVLIVLVLSLGVVLAQELKPVTLTWIAGGVGGGWYAHAGAVAALINAKEPKISIKVIPGGGVVNPVRVSMGEADLGWGITFVDRWRSKVPHRSMRNRILMSDRSVATSVIIRSTLWPTPRVD